MAKLFRDRIQAGTHNLTVERAQQIIQYLLANGVLDGDTRKEQGLYDDALRLLDVLADFFDIWGARLVDHRAVSQLRLYKPGAIVPGVPDALEEEVRAITRVLSADVVAAILMLAILYRQSATTGHLNERHDAVSTVEALFAGVAQQFGRTISTASARTAVMDELRSLRLVRVSDEGGEEDTTLIVRAAITYFIGPAQLKAANSIDIEALERRYLEVGRAHRLPAGPTVVGIDHGA